MGKFVEFFQALALAWSEIEMDVLCEIFLSEVCIKTMFSGVAVDDCFEVCRTLLICLLQDFD